MNSGTIEVPREASEKQNELITILCDNLCLNIFDKDLEGKAKHVLDISHEVFSQLRRSYPEVIKTQKSAYIYVLWSMKAISWNNRAKEVQPGWYEAPGTANEAINDYLPDGSPWQSRIPGRYDKRSTEQKKAWEQSLEMAQWSVKHLKGWFPTWTDQRIIDLLYNGKTLYLPKTVETALKEFYGTMK